MKPTAISTIALFGYVALMNLGDCTPASKVPIQNLPLFTGDEVISVPNSIPISPPHLNPPSTDEYIGEVDTVGTTWWDMQHIGTCGRMICVDNSGWIHVVWMNGLEAGATNRQIYYNLNMRAGWAMNGNVGVPVENQIRGGYVTLAVNADSYPFTAFHVITPASPHGQPHSAVTTDFIPGAGAFFPPWELPYVSVPALEAIWPKIAVDRQGRLHFISTEQPQSGVAGDPMRIFYCRGLYDPLVQSMTFISQVEVAWTENIASDIAASRYSNRVAFTLHSILGDTSQYNNDVCLFISEDGVTWDFQHPLNITNFVPQDTLRAYTDASVLFDSNDNIHVAFTTAYLDEISGNISINNSLIWHWSESTEYYSLVADGWYDGEITWVESCGAWQRYVQRPCLAQDETTGDLFIVYQRYDTADVAANGYPCGEIMISRSTSGGTYWSVGTDVSHTHSPIGEPCWSERDITCNETVVDNSLHLLYLLDRDAGSVIMNEGVWTLNPVQYQRVPIDSIPAIPLMPVYPMHCDSTGMPPILRVETTDNVKVPSTFHLSQNYPNPFNSITMIDFDINRTDHLTLKVYNILGQEVATLVNGNLTAGTYRVPFDGSNFSSGIYFYRLTSSFQTETRKMVVLK